MIYSTTLSSPLGAILLSCSERGVTRLRFLDEPAAEVYTDHHEHLFRAAGELAEYFAGERSAFTVPLDLGGGTDFQRAVWERLGAVPFGSTTTYGGLARLIGKPRGSQAVGLANGSNPIAVIVPCHRVVGTSGKLTGYAGGIERKKWLLRHESATLF